MRPRTSSLFAILLMMAVGSASATKVMSVEMTCPIDGKTFRAFVPLSGSQIGTDLDLKPYGSIIAPWPIEKCPGNGFVLYKEKFTAREIERLRPFVASKEYQDMQRKETNYFLASVLKRHEGASDDLDIAYTLLQATWEVAYDQRYPRYATAALIAFESALAHPATAMEPKKRLQAEQVAGELERRLGRFDAARQRFSKLATMPGVKGDALEKVLEQEMRLVSEKDSANHRIGTKSPKY